MPAKIRLEASDRGFFRKVSQAAFANPFGKDRTELDLKIAGRLQGDQNGLLDEVLGKVAARVRTLDSEGLADVRIYEGNDRELVQTIFLFDLYHRYLDEFDRLISQQSKTGDSPCRALFADNVLSMLARRGFSPERALKIFAIFYQIRRAFYFIDRGLIGQGPSMMTLRMHLWNSVFTHNMRWYDDFLCDRMEDFSTLLLGETGVGKGAAAAAIGRSGFIPFDIQKGCFAGSFTRNFISINLSQYQESLIESELFGHKKGAFTGAVDNHEGIFSLCRPYGSIFLDEIGDVSIPVQIKLLQVLQERTFSPVGSHTKLRFHGRVIAATNKAIDELRHEKKFRDDFFYRLCSDIITVPTLRQRIQEDRGELDSMLSYLIGRMIGHPEDELVVMVRSALERDLSKDYHWPGNVRELEQAVRRTLITRHYTGDSGTSKPDLREALIRGIDTGTLDADAVVRSYCYLLYQKYFTYEEVARRTGLDRRTVKKYVLSELVKDSPGSSPRMTNGGFVPRH
jgi:transcriptional regulator with AAA-type ATPase domain